MAITKKKKITQLPTADSVSGSEWVEIVQDGVNKKALAGQVAASGGALPPGGSAGEVLAKASGTDYDTKWVPGDGSDRRTVTAVTSSSGIVTLDYALGDYFTLELSENVGGFIIDNPPAAGIGGTIAVRITQDSTPRTVAFGAHIQFTDSSPLDTVPTDAGSDTLLIMTYFGGGVVWIATMDTLA